MSTGRCRCSGVEQGGICPACGGVVALVYWCETCGTAVAGKRCPLCGLKAKKLKNQGTPEA